MLLIFDLDDTLIVDNKLIFDKVMVQDLEKMLIKLKQNGHILAIASYNTHPKRILQNLQISKYFKIIIGRHCLIESDIYDCKKIMVKHIMDKLKMENRETIFFDDQLVNIKTIEKMNIETCKIDEQIGLTWGNLYKFNLI